MKLTRYSPSTRSLICCLSVFLLAAFVLMLIGKNSGTSVVFAQSETAQEANAPEAVFPGSGAGPIPDTNVFSGCAAGGQGSLDMTFTVTGLAAPLTDVQVNFTGAHTWVGDVRVTLISPAAVANSLIFARTGSQGATCGFSNDLSGAYTFADSAPASPTWWTAAGTTPVAVGTYRSSTSGGVIGGGANTLITPSFAGLSTAQINGTWILRFEDLSGQDTGSISAANLTLAGSASVPVPDALGDYDGDGKTDYAVVRNAGGISGQITWFISDNATGIPRSQDWGLGADTFVPADFDGDQKDDIAVWRPGIQSQFLIIRSQTNTLQTADFGTASDNASVVGDYNNDGFDDFAVYRPGAAPGAQSFFFVTYGGTLYSQAWGLNGDIPAPGDYDGDGKMDFAVQRAQGADGVFYIRYTAPQADTVTTFGLANDIIVSGNYDSDTKTDLAVITEDGGGFWQWTYRPSSGGADVVDTWGIANTDYPVPGDYNGDGKWDYAVWRPGATPGSLSTFYVMRPVTRHIETRQWGLSEDVPVNLTFAHF